MYSRGDLQTTDLRSQDSKIQHILSPGTTVPRSAQLPLQSFGPRALPTFAEIPFGSFHPGEFVALYTPPKKVWIPNSVFFVVSNR